MHLLNLQGESLPSKFQTTPYEPKCSISIKEQAFLDAELVKNPALGHGAAGIIGLGFTSLSTIDALVNRTKDDAGRSLLYNLFAENPNEPNFIAFALQRSNEPGDEVDGTFAIGASFSCTNFFRLIAKCIGEYEPQYIAVKDGPKIPTWPTKSPSRWNVLLDVVIVGDDLVLPVTQVNGAPSNKAVVLMDSGSSYT